MEKTSSGFYVIDVLPLKQPSGKPHHLEARLSSRSSRPPLSLSRGTARRAAFLEDRRNKLARKTSHVRAVCAANRTRKHTPTTAPNVAATLLERLQLADRNRRNILERREKSCGEAVAHAKEVARTHSLKVAESAAEKKAALEERLRITSARRQRLLTIPRSRLLEQQQQTWGGSDETLESVRADAAVTVQQWWRRRKVGPVLKSFQRFGLSAQKAKSMSFERLVRLVRSEPLIKSVGRVLLRAKKMVPGGAAAAASWKNPSRVFLSAYMIHGHPMELMATVGPEEGDALFNQALQHCATAVLTDFESLLTTYKSTPTLTTLIQRFFDSWTAFYTTFESWKSADSRKIVDGMIAHWLDLERLWLSVKDQVDADVQWRPRIESQQVAIVEKLSKFGPEALSRLREAQEQNRAEANAAHEARQAEEDFIPTTRATTPPPQNTETPLSTSPSHFPPGKYLPKQTVSLPRHISIPTDSVNTIPNPKLPPTPSTEVAPDLSGVVSDFGSQFSNEQLAHELLLDPDFTLKPQRSPLEEQVRTMAKKAFFDVVNKEFEEGKWEYVIGLVGDIREQLLSMVSPTGKVGTELREVLDLELLRQQITTSPQQFTPLPLLQYIQQKLLQLCAPVRDASVRAIATQPSYAAAFEATLEVLETMRLDLANYKLQSLKPHLKAQSVDYERAKFAKALEEGRVKLDRTKGWLKTAYETLSTVAAARNPENVPLPENRVKFEDTYNEALVSLLVSSTLIERDTVPETLLLDAGRMHGMQEEIQAVVVVAAVLTLVKGAVGGVRDKTNIVKKIKEGVWTLIRPSSTDGTTPTPQTTVENISLQVLSTLSTHLPTPLSDAQSTSLKSMIERTLSTRDAVFSLMQRRVQAVVRTYVEKGKVERVSAERSGVGEVWAELESVARRVAILGRYDREVHGGWYDECLKGVVGDV
ncbi:hypothetical protein HDV00_011181 [Rhizophlyctis rosea]|nr:hypothetical protein HDV00_011181 [Rhizophlyctis rosea]